jgi:FtsZ-binding cell division protein ZapB
MDIIDTLSYEQLKAELERERAKVESLRNTLNTVYAERDNARDDAEGLRGEVALLTKENGKLERDRDNWKYVARDLSGTLNNVIYNSIY